ncbi:MAG: helix-turn-helix domain-containing protein [Massilia sp.]
MTSERAEQPAAPVQHHGVPGRALAAQREAMGWTVEQVAEQLKLAVRQVMALEAGDYASLPSPAVTRGFVRAYAKILKLDAAPLVAMIEMDTPPAPDNSATVVRREQKPTSFSQSRFPSHGKRSKLPLGLVAAAVVVVGAGAAAWHFGLVPIGQHGQAVAPGASDNATLLPPPVNGASAPASPSTQEPLQSTVVPLISVPSAGTAAPADGEGSAAAPAAGAAPAAADTAPATAGVSAAPAAPAAAAGANPLVFTAHEDSWISVSPARGGKPLFSRLVKAGSTETIDVAEPVRVVVGNAPGVSATLRGAPVELPGKTARISLK